MRKKIVFGVICLALSTLLLTGCCEHEWVEATCTEPKTCSVCGATEGEAVGHKWEEATCTEPKTCSVCGETEGKAAGHKWEEATCTEPKTCSVCGETQGEALGHTVEEWNVTKEASCTEEGQESGKCTVCKETVDKKIDKLDHTPGDWTVTKEAAVSEAGERTKSCTVCGTVLETEEYELSDEEKEAAFKNKCQSYSYEQIARDPDTYYMAYAVYTGKVVQVMEDDDTTSYRINITPTSWGGYEDTIYVEFLNDSLEGQPRILEDDIVTVWGYNFNTISYKTVMGAKLTIPAVFGLYIAVVG